MKRSRKIMAWTAGGLLAFVAIVIVVIATFDWNRLKPFLSDKVSQAIGRPFAIDGDLTVQWQRDHDGHGVGSLLPLPRFTARQIRIANPAWTKQPHFAHLDALRFRLSLLPLINHRIEVPTLQLVRPNVELERDKDGRANWTFNLDNKEEPSRWTLDIGSVGFDRGQLSFDDALSGATFKATIEPLQKAIPYDEIVAQQTRDARKRSGPKGDAKGEKPAANNESADPSDRRKQATSTTYQFAWKAEGSYRGSPLQGHGKTGAVLALQESDRPFPLQADAHLGDTHIALVGTLTDPLHLGALDMQLWLSGNSMSELYPLTGVALPDTPPYATEGHLVADVGDAVSRYHYRAFHGRVGGSDLSGDLTFVTGGDRPELSGTLHSKLLQFADLAPLIGGSSKADSTDGRTSQPADKLLPTQAFRTDRWQAMDADVTFTGERIVHGEALPIDSLSTHLVMKNGALYLDPLSFGMAGGTVRSNITLDGSRSPMQAVLELHARHLKLKQLFPGFDPMRTSLGEINGNAQLAAHGNSIAALLGSADGELKLLMNDGAISKNLLETAGLNVGNIIIGKLFGDRTVEINCAATDMAATDGVFDMRLFVFDTDDAVIRVTGTVNLATEKLDLDVQPQTKGLRVLTLRSPLYIRGTLKDPDVGVQAGPLLARGAGAVALGVVAAPAAALLALIVPNHEDEQDNTCRAVLQEMRSSGKLLPAGTPAKKPDK